MIRRPQQAKTTFSGLAALATLGATLMLGACAAPTPLDYEARIFSGVDQCGRTITTSSPAAQLWFDQGLTFLYGFNHDEAVRSFHAATLEDPECTMAWWGLAHASGSDINNPEMSDADWKRANDAAQKAIETSGDATPVEAALAHAIGERFTYPAPEDKSVLDEAYADAMEAVWVENRDDPDIATLYAESLMLLQPWDYWTADGQPKGRIVEVAAALEAALRTKPDHAGACHFYVHAMEAAEPKKAEEAADLLAGAVPGSGHLLHMPSHIYVHIGRYADSSDANERAVAADREYLASAENPGFYMLYYAHNLHMLAYSAMMEGREEVALQAARDLEAEVPVSFQKDHAAFVDGIMSSSLHVLIRFGHWEQILREPEPPSYRKMSVAQWHYARGVALSATGRTQEARKELAAFEEAKDEVPEGWRAGSNPAATVLELAHAMLRGEILWREGNKERAFEVLAAGVAIEDGMVYDEPPGWMQPVRHAYGALLMADSQAREAEAVYRADLAVNPGNGWSLLGLQQALTAQGRRLESRVAAEQLAEAWARTDVDAKSSCFCEPGAVAQS